MFRKFDKIAEVYRQGQTTESWYKKTWFSTTDKFYIGHLKAQSINNTIENAWFGKVFKFTTEFWADIKEWDRLVILEENYDVKWISKFEWITFSTSQILLNKC